MRWSGSIRFPESFDSDESIDSVILAGSKFMNQASQGWVIFGKLLIVLGLLTTVLLPVLSFVGCSDEWCLFALVIVPFGILLGFFIIACGLIIIIPHRHDDKPHHEYGLRCSHCKLWRTKDCSNNPAGADLQWASESFACFVPKGQGDGE